MSYTKVFSEMSAKTKNRENFETEFSDFLEFMLTHENAVKDYKNKNEYIKYLNRRINTLYKLVMDNIGNYYHFHRLNSLVYQHFTLLSINIEDYEQAFYSFLLRNEQKQLQSQYEETDMIR